MRASVFLVVSLGLFACSSPSLVLEDGDKEDADDGGGGEGGGSGGDSGGDDGPDPDADEDGDGYSVNEGDCDDEDADVNPDGDEGDVADGVDDDCNGTADDRSVCDDFSADYETIQEGIDDAPEDFTLLICPGTYEEDLVIDDKPITIQSTDGADVTIIEGSGSGPVITITGTDEEDKDWGAGVVGLTFTGGSAANGGGLLASRSSIHVSESVFEGNQASGFGGGVYLTGCEGDFSGNTVDSNVAYEGGGLVSWDSGELIEGNTIRANTSTTVDEEAYNSGAGGGGVLLYGNNEFIDNTVDGNASAYNGGGMYVLYGAPTVSGNTFSGNYSGEDGGGIYMNQSRLDFTDNQVLNNEAYDDAGGVRGYVCQGDFKNNTIYGNVASDDAGGMKVSHSTNVIEDNWFEANVTGDAGGGLELDNDTSDVTGTTFLDNRAGRGAGMHTWRNEGRITFTDLYFEGNEASDCGGAIQMDNNPYRVTMKRVDAFDNEAVDGAALCIDKKPIESEFDVEEPGNAHESVWYVSASTFADNSASDDGAGVYVKFGELHLTNVTIADSYAVEGAIALKEDSEVTLVNVNVSGISGTGGILWEEGDLSISYSNFDDLDGDVIIGGSSPIGTNGNISEDPDFNDPGAWDYSLSGGSDLIDAGDPGIDDTDGSRSDIGASGGPDA